MTDSNTERVYGDDVTETQPESARRTWYSGHHGR